MSLGIIGKKIGMTQIFTEDEKVVPCTVVEAGPCFVTQIKTEEKEGYNAIQLGFETQKIQRQTLPKLIHITKALGFSKDLVKEERSNNHSDKKAHTLKVLKEFRGIDVNQFELGQEIKADIFEINEPVEVIGKSKGKGFQGVMKRHGFSGGNNSHGAHKWHRRPGSIGMCATPGRVIKGKKMPGRMGASRVTQKGLKIVKVIPEQNLMLIKGSIPGPINSFCIIKKEK